jgi:signal transduction histidine kinase
MESLQDAVFRFTHDVGSPLTVVRTLAQLLNEEPDLSPAHRADVIRILEASRDIHQKLIALREFASNTTTRHGAE